MSTLTLRLISSSSRPSQFIVDTRRACKRGRQKEREGDRGETGCSFLNECPQSVQVFLIITMSFQFFTCRGISTSRRISRSRYKLEAYSLVFLLLTRFAYYQHYLIGQPCLLPRATTLKSFRNSLNISLSSFPNETNRAHCEGNSSILSYC